jgi:hypothetical protein
MVQEYRNVHGRRGGRGSRPWLLLPKVLCIGLYLGCVASLSLLWWTTNVTDLGELAVMVGITRRLFVGLAVPALLIAATLGVGLFMQMPGQFLRLRWWQVKMLSLAVGVPVAHLWVSGKLRAVRDAIIQSAPMATTSAAAQQFRIALLLLLAGSVWVIVLGRHKPRLGQNLAAALAASEDQGGPSVEQST